MLTFLVSDLLYALSIGFLVSLLTEFLFTGSNWIPILAEILTFALLGWRHRFWIISREETARHLNRSLPQLQESVQLLLRPVTSLSLLEQLQVNRLEDAISRTGLPPLQDLKFTRAWLVLLVAGVLAITIKAIPFQKYFHHDQNQVIGSSPASGPKEVRPASVTGVSLLLTPPSYTGEAVHQQSNFTIQAIEGTRGDWKVSTNTALDSLSLIFNDRETVAMQAMNDAHTEWTLHKTLLGPGFYQVKIRGKISEMYMIDLLKDQPPSIHIVAPKQYTTLELGASKQVPLKVTVGDDFGVSNSYITATIASGSGEAVKFKEQRIAFPDFSAGRESRVQKTLNLDQLGMKPGDELYYYVSAVDNHRQENRSDIYIITLPDTTELMDIEGLTNGVNLKLDYFRSQRQIIIETEQLLKDRDTITATGFNAKSNNLGIDQKLLRLRYGKFLGEETDNEIGAHHDDDGDHTETVFGDPTKIIEEFTHKHDNAEDATFFDPKLKEQLKATLSEMWKAELQLRLYKPQDALVYEYKALRLLKDLQQQSRSYVAKAAYKTTPLKPEKRLTGDLSKITQPDNQQTMHTDRAVEEDLRQAAGLLEGMKSDQSLSVSGRKVLQAAASQLGTQAAAKPSLYLSSFEAMKRVLSPPQGNSRSIPDLNLAVKGIQSMITAISKSPGAQRAGIRQQLSQQYFLNLHSNR